MWKKQHCFAVRKENYMKIKSLFVGDTDNTFIQFFRYCFVGGFAFVVDFGVMTLLTEVFSVYPVVSSTVSFVAGLLVNYLLSTFWIFKNSKIIFNAYQKLQNRSQLMCNYNPSNFTAVPAKI